MNAAIIALGAAFIYAYQHNEEFRKGVQKVFKWVKDNKDMLLQIVSSDGTRWVSVDDVPEDVREAGAGHGTVVEPRTVDVADEAQVGALVGAGQLIAFGAQPRDDALGIHQRLGASQRNKADFGRGGLLHV